MYKLYSYSPILHPYLLYIFFPYFSEGEINSFFSCQERGMLISNQEERYNKKWIRGNYPKLLTLTTLIMDVPK